MEKQTYLVAEGVPFVNGRAVPADRRVALTSAEAAFDLALGRIAPAPIKTADAVEPSIAELVASEPVAAEPEASRRRR